MFISPKTPEVRVPRLVGLMAVDAREAAMAHGVLLAAPDRPDFHRAVVDHVVRQYPPPGVEVPRGAVVTVWFDFGEGRAAEARACTSRVCRDRAGAGCSASWTRPRGIIPSRRSAGEFSG